MLIEIKHRWSLKVLFAAEISDNTEEIFRVRAALTLAVKSGADLSGADLRSVVLRGAVLRGAVLRGADLRGADLSGADLSGADLRSVVLRGAVLRGAVLRGAVLRGADLRGADLSGADLRSVVLRGAVLRGAVLRGAVLRGAVLRGADLRGAHGKQLPRATPEQAVANLDKVREIILDNQALLDMGHWHEKDGWQERTCAEEAVCGTTHCLAGWLQVCTTEPALKTVSAELAGILSAPVAAKMFYRGNTETLEWLRDRKYAA